MLGSAALGTSSAPRATPMSNLIEDFQWRGLLKNHTDLDALGKRLAAGPLESRPS